MLEDDAYQIKGRTYGELTVLECLGANLSRNVEWLCRCKCGNKCVRTTAKLRSPHGLKTCGHNKKETHVKRTAKPIIVINGIPLTGDDIAELLGISKVSAYARVKRTNNVEEVLRPKHSHQSKDNGCIQESEPEMRDRLAEWMKDFKANGR